MDPFVECQKCGSWGGLPPGFHEARTFAVCPTCQGTMSLLRGVRPDEIGLSVRKYVQVKETRPAR